MVFKYLLLLSYCSWRFVWAENVSSCEIRMALGLPTCDQDSVALPNKTYAFCKTPKVWLNSVKETLTCDKVIKYNPICSRNLTLTYTELPPYSFKNGQKHDHGMLLNILNEILVQRCCLGCIQFEIFTAHKPFIRNVIDQFNESTAADILLPAYSNGLSADSLPYISLLPLEQIAVIAKAQELTSEDLMSDLIKSAFHSWPLMIMAFALAICAGSIIWILDTWTNKGHFPRSFPVGPFEGFWWAYVSMTTVGYGDKTPSSPAARIFAVIWILIGITIFNMFTASLTSTLSNSLSKKASFEMANKKIGVLSYVPNINVTLRVHHAKPKGYEDIESLKSALLSKHVDGIAMETVMAVAALHSKELNGYVIAKTLADNIGSTIGMASRNKDIINMVKYFTTTMYAYHVTGLDEHLTLEIEEEEDVHTSSFSTTHLSFVLTITVAIAITIICLLLGWLVNKHRQKNKQTKKENVELSSKQT